MATVTKQTSRTYLIEFSVAEAKTLTREVDLRKATVSGSGTDDLGVLDRVVNGWLGERRKNHGDLQSAQIQADFDQLSPADQAKVRAVMPGFD